MLSTGLHFASESTIRCADAAVFRSSLTSDQ